MDKATDIFSVLKYAVDFGRTHGYPLELIPLNPRSGDSSITYVVGDQTELILKFETVKGRSRTGKVRVKKAEEQTRCAGSAFPYTF